MDKNKDKKTFLLVKKVRREKNVQLNAVLLAKKLFIYLKKY
jgi:hypothetical protein